MMWWFTGDKHTKIRFQLNILGSLQYPTQLTLSSSYPTHNYIGGLFLTFHFQCHNLIFYSFILFYFIFKINDDKKIKK